jgi:hypothetical protein
MNTFRHISWNGWIDSAAMASERALDHPGTAGAATAPVELLRRGMVGRPDQVASVVHGSVGADGGYAIRTVDVRVWGGIDVQLVADRGLDIWRAWWRGTPLAWLSRVGDVPALPAPVGTQWNDAFTGGLLATCGLRNVGAPSEGHGQHGRFSHLPARDVLVRREERDGELAVVVSGEIREASALAVDLRCRRTITTTTGSGMLEVADEVTNHGPATEPAPMLYHVNLGAPLWTPGARLELASAGVEPRDEEADGWPEWSVAPAVAPASAGERVYEHRSPPDTARVLNDDLGIALRISWSRETLPRLHQWVQPAAGAYVLGIEPANCSVLGRAHDRAQARLPVLEPGETRRTWLRFTVAG